MDKLNVIHHMNEFRNILSYASNIGFFFGAGTSCAFGLPSIGQLTDKVKESLKPDQLRLFISTEKTIKDLQGKANITIEDVLNYLRSITELTRGRKEYDFFGLTGEQATELDKEICKCIFRIIRSDTEKADVSDLRRFFAWFEAANRDFVKEIYTTNYDMLLELAMEANRTPYYDGFIGSYEPFFSPESIETFPTENDSTAKWIRLWKIHGSLNWMKKPATSASKERIIRMGGIIEPENELMIYPSREKYNMSRKEPYIAYFDRFKNYLNRGELVFIICGYSFGDEHINDIIFNALRNNSRLYITVLCHNDDQVCSMAAVATSFMNLCLVGPTKVFANGALKDWIFDDSEDKDVGSEMYWKSSKCTLGNFRDLIAFLIENSGRRNIIEEVANAK